MTKAEIIERINGFLVDELGLDSLDYVDLVVIIESNFGFKVVAEDFINISTFQNFYDYVERKVTEKASA